MPKHKWEGNIKTVLKETGCEDESWICLVQDCAHWVGFCERGNEPSGFVKSKYKIPKKQSPIGGFTVIRL